MRKLHFLILSLLLLTIVSCEKDDDVVYISHKLILSVEIFSDYEMEFTWNITSEENQMNYVLVQANEKLENTVYKDIVDYLVNGDTYEDYPYWRNQCYVNYLYWNSSSYTRYYYSGSDYSSYYYVLLAYNSDGDYILSNSLYI